MTRELMSFLEKMIESYHSERGPWESGDDFYRLVAEAERVLGLEVDSYAKRGYSR